MVAIRMDKRLAARVDPSDVVQEALTDAARKLPDYLSVYSVGCERAVHFYAMEYVEGQTVAQVIRELRRLEGLEEDDAPQADREALGLADSLASGRLAPSRVPCPRSSWTCGCD